MLEQEFKYYQDHKEELIGKYNNKFIVIMDQQVIADYPTREEALEETQKSHKIGTFLVQHVSANNVDQVQRFHSRAVFNESADSTAPRIYD